MADDFFGPPTDAAADVPAEIQIDGEVTEINTGEQVANEGGNPVWWDETYPGQTTTTPANPTQDAYGLNILNAAETKQLTRNINPAFINSFTDPNAPTAATVTNAVNTSASKLPVFVDSSGIVYDPVTGVSYPVNSAGQQIIPANVAASIDPVAQSRIEAFNRTPYVGGAVSSSVDPNAPTAKTVSYAVNKSATALNTGAGAAIAAANQQTAADAARLNAQASNPYLTNIDKAATEISRGQDGIATATQTIQSAQQKISDSESYIAQNNAELADPNISAERRAVLEANNAAQTQNIFDQTQSITENQAYIATTTETIQANEATIDTNSAGYRASTAGSNVPVVDVNADPNFRGPQQITATAVNPTTSAAAINTRADGESVGNIYPDGFGGFVNGDGQAVDANGLLIPTGNNVTRTATAVDPTTLEGYGVNEVGATGAIFGLNPDAEAEAAAAAQVGRQLAQQQAVNAAQKKVANNGDWRVRLSLAPGARYLYNVDGDPGILQPLAVTGGVIFPYTPKIEMSYKADYESYALTHSNYKGYFYKSSYVDAVSMTATFTAQDSAEANYLLAVIHFFRSVTKMFYGQDAQRGAPPPLVYLTGLGQYQFNGHPCVVTSFNYNLPSDVDYIRARSPNINGTNMLTRRDKQDLPTNPISGAVGRLKNLFSGQGISYGAEICRPPPPTLGQNNPTYVPTKLDISLGLLPVQTRSQVTNRFSLQQYATGALLGGSPGTSGQGGFW